jgi:hypothetical protein
MNTLVYSAGSMRHDSVSLFNNTYNCLLYIAVRVSGTFTTACCMLPHV